DLMALHQPHDLLQRRISGHSLNVLAHDLANFAPARVDIFGRESTGTNEKLDPARPFALCPGLGSTQEIAFGHDADQRAAGIHHRETAEPALEHHADGLKD